MFPPFDENLTLQNEVILASFHFFKGLEINNLTFCEIR